MATKEKAEPVADRPSPDEAQAKKKPKPEKVLTPGAIWKTPPAKTVTIPLEQLTFDPRLQHRASLTDEDTVEYYSELITEGKKLKSLKAVSDGKTTWVYDGFQRGAALSDAGETAAEVEVTKGDFTDALYLSLSSNGDHGLHRNEGDKRRAVFAILDTPEILEPLLAKAEGNGGVHRVFAAACEVSRGLVQNAFDERGIQARGNKLVKKKPKPESPPTNNGKASHARPETLPIPGLEPDAPHPAAESGPVDPEAQRRANDAAFAQLCAKNYADRCADAVKKSRQLGAAVAALLADEKYRTIVMIGLAEAGFPVDQKQVERYTTDYQPYLEIFENWPTIHKLSEAFREIGKRVAEVQSQGSPATSIPAAEVPAGKHDGGRPAESGPAA